MSISIEIDFPQNAFLNMQKDETLCAEHDLSADKNLQLRFYSWLNPAISCGYAQNPAKLLDLNKAEKLGVEIVKRLTGGGMVFHQPGELTYALVAPQSALPPGIIPSCNFISEIFIKALRKVGIPTELAETAGFDGEYERDICFARPAKYEVVCRGKKLIGSAQKRGKNSLFQHGSLAIEPLLPVFKEFFTKELNQTNICELLPEITFTYQELAEIIKQEFLNQFG